MKRLSFFVVLLIIVAVAVFVAVAVDGNKADAYSDGWSGGCDTCHATTGIPPSGTGLHAVAAHATVATCTSCHATTGDTPAISKCTVCHGAVSVIITKGAHPNAGCAACHGAT